MAKKSKKQFNIGDKFLSWEVISCEDPKKYRYLCRCSCGSEKVFNKYNLLRGSYAPCKNCDSAKLSNVAYLRRYWNSELNGVTFTRTQDFSLTQSYWFMCDNKHNIKSTIKDFSVERCLGCKTNIKSSFYREQAYEYALQLFRSIFDNVYIESYSIVIGDLKVAIIAIEKDRFDSYRNYYNNEAEFIRDATKLQMLKQFYKSNGYTIFDIKLENNLEKNVDIFRNLMVQLTHIK